MNKYYYKKYVKYKRKYLYLKKMNGGGDAKKADQVILPVLKFQEVSELFRSTSKDKDPNNPNQFTTDKEHGFTFYFDNLKKNGDDDEDIDQLRNKIKMYPGKGGDTNHYYKITPADNNTFKFIILTNDWLKILSENKEFKPFFMSSNVGQEPCFIKYNGQWCRWSESAEVDRTFYSLLFTKFKQMGIDFDGFYTEKCDKKETEDQTEEQNTSSRPVPNSWSEDTTYNTFHSEYVLYSNVIKTIEDSIFPPEVSYSYSGMWFYSRSIFFLFIQIYFSFNFYF